MCCLYKVVLLYPDIFLRYEAMDPEYIISIPLLRDFFRDLKQIGNTLGDLLNLTLVLDYIKENR